MGFIIEDDGGYRLRANQRQEFLPHRVGHIDYPHRLGPALPEVGERLDLVADVLPFATTLPRQVDVETLPIVEPTIPRFVHAAAERDLATLGVGNDADLFVKHSRIGHRLATVVHWDGHLHVEPVVGDHPREGFETAPCGRVRGIEVLGEHPLFDLFPEVVATLDRHHLVGAQRAANE